MRSQKQLKPGLKPGLVIWIMFRLSQVSLIRFIWSGFYNELPPLIMTSNLDQSVPDSDDGSI